MELWVRPYNADAGILELAIQEGFRPDGVMLDANIAVAYPNVLRRVLEATEGLGVAIDPNTAKLRSAPFRSKPTYKKLPFFDGEMPSLVFLRDSSKEVTEAFTDLQAGLGASVLLSPYLLLEDGHFPASIQLDVQRKWYDSFFAIAPGYGRPAYASLCITAQALATPEGFDGAASLIKEFGPERVYLLIVDYELGEDRGLDQTVARYLGSLSKSGVDQILLGRGPAWAPLLAPSGLSGYVTGINYMASLKREYFTREEEIGGIKHNFYIPRRFVKAESSMVEQVYAEDLIEPCPCPVCTAGVPYEVNDIRRHFLFARELELTDVRNSANPRNTVRGWVSSTSELLQEASALGIDLIGRPPVNRWAEFLA